MRHMDMFTNQRINMFKTITIIGLALAALISLSGCGESLAAREVRIAQELDLFERRTLIEARARAQADAEVARLRADAERARVEQEERLRVQREAAQQEQLAMALRKAETDQRRKAVEDLEAGFRTSFAIENTAVLQLRNPSGVTADFQLRCYTVGGNQRTFAIALVPGQVKEIGFLEGWDGNFVRGEYCTAQYEGQSLWRVRRT
jgi:hypothetical protein